MFDTKIKIRKELLEKLKTVSQEQGCSSVEEFVESALERELQRIDQNRKVDSETLRKEQEAEDIANKLKGLGYID